MHSTYYCSMHMSRRLATKKLTYSYMLSSFYSFLGFEFPQRGSLSRGTRRCVVTRSD